MEQLLAKLTKEEFINRTGFKESQYKEYSQGLDDITIKIASIIHYAYLNHEELIATLPIEAFREFFFNDLDLLHAALMQIGDAMHKLLTVRIERCYNYIDIRITAE